MHGQGATKGEPPYGITPERCGSAHRSGNGRAGIVAQLVSRGLPGSASIALTSARSSTYSPLPIYGPVSYVAKSLVVSEATLSPSRLARISAVGRYDGNAPVYNLTVEGAGLYYANGILVSNTDGEDHSSDAVRYFCMTQAGIQRTDDRRFAPGSYTLRSGQPVTTPQTGSNATTESAFEKALAKARGK